MNIKKLTEPLLEDWAQKVLCLVLAIVIYVFHIVATLDRKSFTVPLKVEAQGLMMPNSDVPRYVKITVRSTAENMPVITSAGFSAALKLNDFTEAGSVSVPVSVSISPELMLLDPLEYSVTPDTINLTLDSREIAYIPVKPALSGEVEHGYMISQLEANPSTVKVIGPASVLNKVTHIDTKKVIVSGAAKTFSKETKVDNINAKLNVEAEGDIRVTVTVQPASDTRSFSGIVPALTGLSESLEVVGDVPAVTLRLAGTVPVLEGYSYTEKTVTADCSEIQEPGTYDIPVFVRVPANLSLVEKSPETISITVVAHVDESADEPEEVADDDAVPLPPVYTADGTDVAR